MPAQSAQHYSLRNWFSTTHIRRQGADRLKSYYDKHNGKDTIPCKQSNVVHLSLVDKCADTNEHMEEMLSKLHKGLDVSVRVKYLVVVGDQKTYTRLRDFKDTYGTDLDWVIHLMETGIY